MDFTPLIKDTKGMTGAHLKEMVMMAYMESLEASGYKKNTKITQANLEKSMKAIVSNRVKYHHAQSPNDTESVFHQ